MGLGFGFAGVKLTADRLYNENIVNITVAPVFGILGVKRFLGFVILGEIIVVRFRQYNADIRI